MYIPFLVLVYFNCIAYAVFMLIKKYKISSGVKRDQIRYVLIGALLGFGGGATNYPLWYNIRILPVGNILVSLGIGIMAYAIVRYRLMDIRIVITRVGIFGVVYTLVLGLPFWIGHLTKKWIYPTGVAVFLASLGPYIYIRLQKRFERKLLKDELDRQENLRKLSSRMMEILDLKSLLGLIVRYLVRILKVECCAIYLRQDDGSYIPKTFFIRDKSVWLPDVITPQWVLVTEIEQKKNIISAEEFKHSSTGASSYNAKLNRELNRLNAAFVIPAFLKNTPFGCLILGPATQFSLTELDINFLASLCNQATLAIDNALYHQREVEYIAEQTRRGALADMAPGASHQFNNRLNAITMAASITLDLIQDNPGLSNEELLNRSAKAFKKISDETIKGKEITSAILQRTKVKLTFDKMDITKIIQNAIILTKLRHTKEDVDQDKEDVEFIFNPPDNLPELLLSEAPIQDVFENLFHNAMDAIIIKKTRIKDEIIEGPPDYRGRITINITQDDDVIEITVEDNGIGIPGNEINKLFAPYFTTKATAIKGISGGTGLGLWVIRDFVERHGGRIIVNSTYLKKTRFMIRLPIHFNPPKRKEIQ